MQQHQLFAKDNKWQFGMSSIEHLGHIISAEGVQTNLMKIETVKEWPVLINVKQLKGFLRLTGY